jgi:hypothetical protein
MVQSARELARAGQRDHLSAITDGGYVPSTSANLHTPGRRSSSLDRPPARLSVAHPLLLAVLAVLTVLAAIDLTTNPYQASSSVPFPLPFLPFPSLSFLAPGLSTLSYYFFRSRPPRSSSSFVSPFRPSPTRSSRRARHRSFLPARRYPFLSTRRYSPILGAPRSALVSSSAAADEWKNRLHHPGRQFHSHYLFCWLDI